MHIEYSSFKGQAYSKCTNRVILHLTAAHRVLSFLFAVRLSFWLVGTDQPAKLVTRTQRVQYDMHNDHKWPQCILQRLLYIEPPTPTEVLCRLPVNCCWSTWTMLEYISQSTRRRANCTKLGTRGSESSSGAEPWRRRGMNSKAVTLYRPHLSHLSYPTGLIEASENNHTRVQHVQATK